MNKKILKINSWILIIIGVVLMLFSTIYMAYSISIPSTPNSWDDLGKFIIVIGTVIVYLLSLSFLLNGTGHGVKDKNQAEEEQTSIIEEDVISDPDIPDEEEQLEDAVVHHTEITISAVGDCTLGRDDRGSYSYSLPYYLEINQYDYSYFFRGVYDILSKDESEISDSDRHLVELFSGYYNCKAGK